MRQQKLLERSGRPAMARSCSPASIRVIASLNFTTRCTVGGDTAASAALWRRPRTAAPCRNALCVAGAGEREGQAMLQRLGEAEVALLVAFTQVKRCASWRFTLVESSVISAPAGGLLLLPTPVTYCQRSDRAPRHHHQFLNFADPVDMMQMKRKCRPIMPTTSPSSSARW